MLRMNPFKSAAQLKEYFTKALRGEYYSHDAERTAQWQGKAAERLGIAGQDVTDEVFARLSENQHPDGRGQLTPRMKTDRCPAYDLTFSVPKSVTLLHALTGDDRILECTHRAVSDTMAELEQRAMTRVRRKGQDHDKITGNLVWAEFVHTTSRPVDGIPDPHLHVHCVVLNATFDEDEKRFAAAQFREIKRDAPYFQAAFYSRVARSLNALGYATERVDGGWEIAGVPRALCEKYSRRTQEIERLAAELGIHAPEEKAQLGVRTRKHKRVQIDRGQLESKWSERLSNNDREAIAQVAAGNVKSRDRVVTERDCLDAAIEHQFERVSVSPTARLLEQALMAGLGHVTPERIKAEAAQHLSLLFAEEGVERLCTTRSVLAEERLMIDLARNGRGRSAPLLGDRPWTPTSNRYTKDQIAAIQHVLSSPDKVILINGGAGTGKTTLMQAAIAAMEQVGRPVMVIAPSVDASRGVLRESGFANADTVRKFLDDSALQNAYRGGVIWCDEAGLLGTKDMLRLHQFAYKLDAKLMLSGDCRQHASVSRGDALRLLETYAGLKPARVGTVVRQQGSYKDAVEAMSKGRFEESMAILDELGAIREIPDTGRQAQIAMDYLESVRSGRSTLVVAPTHAEGEQVTDLIRAALKRDGRLSQEERLTIRHRDLSWTAAQKKDAAVYRDGQVIRFHRQVQGFRTDEIYRVIGRNEHGHIQIQSTNRSRPQILPLAKSGSFSVFEEKMLRVAEGDRVRVTRNGKTKDGKHRLNSGSFYRIDGFTKQGHIKLDNGWTIDRAFGHLNHAYTTTSHAAQGQTCDRVLISQPQSTLGAASPEQVYVSISRGRHDVVWYTDNREALIEAIGRFGMRRSAIELMNETAGQRHRQNVHEHGMMLQRVRTYEKARQRATPARGRGLLGVLLGR
jgi:conjugative relaxase-like TrwC/TraI family protein